MKRISVILGLIGALIACEKAALSPRQEFAGPDAARRSAEERSEGPSANTSLFRGRKALLTSFTIAKNRTGTYDIVFLYDRKQTESVTGLGLRDVSAINDLLQLERPADFQINRQQIVKWTATEANLELAIPDLLSWLQANPEVAKSIVWQDDTGAHPWPTWSLLERVQLLTAYQKAWQGSSIDVPEVPVNQKIMADADGAGTIMSIDDAWAYYRASVGHSLALELGKRVNWSVRDYSQPELAQLFGSPEMFYHNDSPEGYMISNGYHGSVTPGPPRLTYQFLKDNGRIGGTRLTTIGRTIDWCRHNLSHYMGGNVAANMEAHWQYRGAAPMSRILSGTFNPQLPNFGVRHWTAGCHGTAGFFRMLLRTVNIPVKMVFGGYHSQVYFMSEGRYLDHGDAPYNLLTYDPNIPAGELLIDQTKYTLWFGLNLPLEVQSKNVGRRSRELALIYLPNYVLRKYCEDINAGKTHANGIVLTLFSPTYTLAQLEAANLWGRLNAKLTLMGGCSMLPSPY